MNLGDSFGISIFVDESSRFAPKISASHFFMVSERWNCLGFGVFTMRILYGIIADFDLSFGDYYYINIKL